MVIFCIYLKTNDAISCMNEMICLKAKQQNNKLFFLQNPDSMSELICTTSLNCIINSDARTITNLIQYDTGYTI